MDNDLTIKVQGEFGAATMIAELMSYFNATQQDFAARIGVSQKYLSNVLHFKAFISPKRASRIETITGTPAQMLLHADAQYKLNHLGEDADDINQDLFLIPYDSKDGSEDVPHINDVVQRKSFVEAEAKAMGIIPSDMPSFETVDELVSFLLQA